MFDFIRKPLIWSALDRGDDRRIASAGPFHLKTIQDLAILGLLSDTKGLDVAEVGGRRSRLLPYLAKHNRCVNIEKFEGAAAGPSEEIFIPGVRNVHCFLGEGSRLLATGSFDLLFSISVVEHVVDDDLPAFFSDQLRVLRQGGQFVHAIDIYVGDAPDDSIWTKRFDMYRAWMEDAAVRPLGTVFNGPFQFSTDMATNPDDMMYEWGKIAPSLIGLRQRAQSVSLLMGGIKL